MRSSRVQTAAIQLLSEQLSSGLGAEVHIDRVDFHFFNRLELDGIYLSDQHQDTLLYVPKLQLNFNPFAIEEDKICFPKIQVDDPYFCLLQDSIGTNIDFLLRAFAPSDTISASLPFIISMDDIYVSRARIRYINLIQQTDIIVSDLNAHIQLPWITSDSLDAHLEFLHLRAAMAQVDAHIEGDFHGSKDTLYADGISLVYKQKRILQGNICLIHPMQLDSLYAHVHCQDLYCNAPLLQDLLSDCTREPITLPTELNRMGDLHYKGKLCGRLNNLQLHGAFITDLGSITTDATVGVSTDWKSIQVDGCISANRFKVGRLIGNSSIDAISINIQGEATYQQGKPLQAQANLHIPYARILEYNYQDFNIRGQLQDSIFEGNITCNDNNINFHSFGIVDFSSHPKANILFTLNQLHLDQLGILDKKVQNDNTQFKAHLNFATDKDAPNAIDHLNGYLVFDSIRMQNYGTEMFLRQVRINSQMTPTSGNVSFSSDIVNAQMGGWWKWSTFAHTLQRFGSALFPNYLDKPNTIRDETNDVDFYADFHHLDSLLRILNIEDVHIPEHQTIHGYIHESEDRYALKAHVPTVEFGNTQLSDCQLSIGNTDKEANLDFQLIEHTLHTDSTALQIGDIGIYLHAAARNDSIITYSNIGDLNRERQQSDFNIVTHLTEYMNKPLVNIHILPSAFFIADTLWHVADAQMEYNGYERTFSIHDFDFRCSSQYIHANGVNSEQLEDSIRIDLQNINLEYLLRFTNIPNTIYVQGLASGWAQLRQVLEQPRFEANLQVPLARLNYTDMGYLTATATIEQQTKHVLINGNITDPDTQHKIASVEGIVKPENKTWELLIHTDSTDASLINFWTSDILSDIRGRSYGDIRVFGHKIDTWVTARLLAKDASLVVPQTGVRYYFTDSIILDSTHIRFPELHVQDIEGHRGTFKGWISHNMFTDMHYDLTAHAFNMLALDLKADPQAFFYGRVYGDADVHIYGNEMDTHIDINAETTNNSDFYLSLASASNATDNGFITFESLNQNIKLNTDSASKVNRQPAAGRNAKFSMNINLEATPQTRLHLLMASHSGDGIVCWGDGDLRLQMVDDDCRLYGTYMVQSGTFLFTLANLVHRKFQIAEGSTIVWNGNPEIPELDVIARYKLTASLRELFGTDIANLSTDRTSVPVNCVLHMTEQLTNPILNFAIEFPQSDESVASQAQSIINTDEMLMRQVINLLVFNSFSTPEYLQDGSATMGINQTYSLISSTVTGQINSWLSRVTDIFSLGFNIRAEGEGATASQEYETQFSITPISRLSINGNFGYRYNDLSNRPFFGDVDLEYQLTKNGKLRAKAYTHTVDKYSLKQANTVQGIGFIFRHDYNWGDIRRKREARKQEKQEKREKSRK